MTTVAETERLTRRGPIGFAIDSAIESFSGVLLGLRLSSRLRSGETDEGTERLALRLGDNPVLADAAETRICVLLSVSPFAMHEGIEAWQGELAGEHRH